MKAMHVALCANIPSILTLVDIQISQITAEEYNMMQRPVIIKYVMKKTIGGSADVCT